MVPGGNGVPHGAPMSRASLERGEGRVCVCVCVRACVRACVYERRTVCICVLSVLCMYDNVVHVCMCETWGGERWWRGRESPSCRLHIKFLNICSAELGSRSWSFVCVCVCMCVRLCVCVLRSDTGSLMRGRQRLIFNNNTR